MVKAGFKYHGPVTYLPDNPNEQIPSANDVNEGIVAALVAQFGGSWSAALVQNA